MTDSEPKPIPATPESTPPAAPEEPAVQPPSAAEPADLGAAPRAGVHLGTGRRKSAVARVRLMPGSGKLIINNRDLEAYFTEPQDRSDTAAPLELTGVRRHWDVRVNVHGGGHTGQAGAIRLGLARALLKAYTQFEPTLREAGYLTRDSRRVERKKPGQRKARRRFQFSKR